MEGEWTEKERKKPRCAMRRSGRPISITVSNLVGACRVTCPVYILGSSGYIHRNRLWNY